MQATWSIPQLFPGFEPELYSALLQHGEVREAKAGDILIRAGQPIRFTMLVLDGSVRLYQHDDEGSDFFLYHLGAGQACAVSMVCGYGMGESNITARALTDCTLLRIPLEYMEEWMTRYKSWNQFVIRTYRKRYMELLETINAIAFKNMDERLEFYILRQVKQLGNHIKLTHQEIAGDLNSSREVISRLLKKMEKNGWLIQHRNSFEWIRPGTGV